MEKKTVLFLHGFASSGQSEKALYFRKKCAAVSHVEFHAIDFNPTLRDFATMTTTGLIDRLRQYVLDHSLEDIHLIASSYGGLIALRYAHRFGGVDKMLLLAPGLAWLSGGLSQEALDQWKEAGTAPVYHEAFQVEIPVNYDLQVDGLRYLERVPPPAPMIIIHGTSDTTVPTDHSREYAADHPDRVDLIEVQAGHNLNDHLDLIWGHAQAFLLGIE